MECVDAYINKLEIKGLTRKVYQPEGMNPLITYVIEPTEDKPETKNILMYGHLDKMPYEEAWDEGLSPTEPVIKGDLMFGRGAADDGFAPFSCMLAIKAAQLQGASLPRLVLVLESEEESGSEFLTQLLQLAEDTIKVPDILFCMDSGCLDYK